MSNDSDKEEDPPHLARYREYKRRQEVKRQQKRTHPSSYPPSETPITSDPSSSSLLDHLINHRLTPPILKLSIWVSLLLFFAHHEFGSVFFLGSIPVLVWQSMEEYRRGPRELSAYSVFNENMERLDGTFTSEQWEKELRYGPAAVMKREWLDGTFTSEQWEKELRYGPAAVMKREWLNGTFTSEQWEKELRFGPAAVIKREWLDETFTS